MIRIGVVGCGWSARTHVPTWLSIEGCRVVAFCDTDVARATSVADRFNISKVYNELPKMIKGEDLDI